MFAAATEAAAQGSVQNNEPAPAPAPAPAPEPTSEKLTALQKEAGDLWAAFGKTKYGTKEHNDAKKAMLLKEKEIDAEISDIRKKEAEAKIAELRSARIALRTNYKVAVLANAGKNANADTAAAEQAAETELDNMLLPAAGKPATTSATTTGEKGKTGQEIYDHLKTRIDGGMDASDAVKEVIALGYSRGTVGSVRTANWPAVK